MGIMDHFHRDSDEHKAYDQLDKLDPNDQHHKSKLSHEMVAGAASFMAAKAYEEHCRKNGKPADHAKAVELMAGFAGGAIDKLIESRGLDFVDRQKAKHDAKKRAEAVVAREEPEVAPSAV